MPDTLFHAALRGKALEHEIVEVIRNMLHAHGKRGTDRAVSDVLVRTLAWHDEFIRGDLAECLDAMDLPSACITEDDLNAAELAAVEFREKATEYADDVCAEVDAMRGR